MQWAGGNDLSWGHTDKSNYPYGENLNQPQNITSALLIFIYKVFASLTTPICGLNLLELLGYMSTGLVMYGLIRWLLKRNDIAVFAGFAATFVPFHLVNAQSHINYIYGSTFIGVIWAYLWLISRPTYKRALVLGAVSAIGFYFDGYFIFITGVLLAGLFASSFIYDLLRSLLGHTNSVAIWREALHRAKYLVVAGLSLGLLLAPILITYEKHGAAINYSLATGRSKVKSETELYGVKPIEFVLPSYNSALMPPGYPKWRETKLHGSNFSEATLYIGYTVMILALISIAGVFYWKHRRTKAQNIPYVHLVFTAAFTFLVCLLLSLPAEVTLFGRQFQTPVNTLTDLTSAWRTLSRMFLAIDPLMIVLASLGLYIITKNRPKAVRLAIVMICGLLLFFEYLPWPLHANGDLYKDAPSTYRHLRRDHNVKLVAEYPFASFVDTPEIFTYQPVDNKTLLNASTSVISRGPFDASIAGLNDPQTLGVLKRLDVDVILAHGFSSDNPDLVTYYQAHNTHPNNKTVAADALYSYTIRDPVTPRDASLIIKKGYESLSVDNYQISHRYVTNKATMGIGSVNYSPLAKNYDVRFEVASICPVNAHVTVMQFGKVLWSGSAGEQPVPINLAVASKDFYVQTAYCSIGITNMSADPLSP